MIKDAYGNRRFYGVYRGIVTDNNDPLNQGRVKLKVPQVLFDQVTHWAWGCVQPGVIISIPTVGTGVFVMFESGDPSYPIWMGAFNQTITPPIFGSFQGTSIQAVSSSVPTVLTLDTTDASTNVKIVSGDRLTMAVAGTYNVQFSIQLSSTAAAVHDVYLWLAVNGAAVAGSNGIITMPARKSAGVAAYAVAGWNYALSLNAGDYVQLFAEADSTAASTISTYNVVAGGLNSHTIASQSITTGTQYTASTGITHITISPSAPFTVGETAYISGVIPNAYNGAWVTQTGTSGTDLYIKTNSNLGNITNSAGVVSEIPYTPALVVTVTQIK